MSPQTAGVDSEAASALGIRVIHALSLPGKLSPVTAGRIAAQTLLELFAEEGGGGDD